MRSNHDYTKYLILTLDMTKKSGITFDKCLKTLERIDALTFRCPKLLYLQNWENKSVDDFDENIVDDRFKTENETAYTALKHFVSDARAFNTMVSLEFDYSLGTSFKQFNALYRENNCFIDESSDSKMRINYKSEYTSCLYEKRFDEIFRTFPFLVENGTVMLDSFVCDVDLDPFISSKSMIEFRNKIIDKLNDYGVDILTDELYREGNFTPIGNISFVKALAKSRFSFGLLTKIPAVKSLANLKKEEIIRLYPHVIVGSLNEKKRCKRCLYDNFLCLDDYIDNENWENEFSCDFALKVVPFFYLSGKVLRSWRKTGSGIVLNFSDSTVSDSQSGVIKFKGIPCKMENMVCLPIHWRNNCYLVFNTQNCDKKINIQSSSAKIYVTDKYNNKLSTVRMVQNNILSLSLEGEKLYYIES